MPQPAKAVYDPEVHAEMSHNHSVLRERAMILQLGVKAHLTKHFDGVYSSSTLGKHKTDALCMSLRQGELLVEEAAELMVEIERLAKLRKGARA